MKSTLLKCAVIIPLLAMLPACVTTKSSKKEAGWLKTKMHDMNARYNGIFNAKELYKESITQLEGAHEDNFNQVLDIYPYGTDTDRKLVEENMDLAIEKVVKVASLHEPSKWVDDCYVIMGKAQYLKGDYESAQETLEYFVEDFNPKDPNSRVYQAPDRKSSSKDRKKQKDNERKIQQEEREKVKKEKEKTRKQEAKDRKKAREQAEKERKQRNKDRKKGKKTPRKPTVEKPAEEAEPKKEATVVASVDNEVPLDPDEEYLQRIAEEDRKKKEKKIEKGEVGNGGFLKHKPAYYEGMLWLTKTLIAREKWIEANYFLDKLENEIGVLDKVKEELPTVRADFYLQQGDYANATTALVSAIDQSPDRKLKARMAFILAQSYQMNGQAAEAQKAFASVKKFKTSYEMELNAELNQLKNAWVSGSSSSEDITRKLERIAKQDRNRNYLGPIYSSIAEVKLVDGDNEGAMEYFQKALASSASSSVKADIYYRLGTLFFGQEEYKSAKLYYDSTLVVMDEKDPRFKPTSRYSASLKDIVKNLDIISSQDSLLRLGAMSEEELTRFAESKAEKDWRAKKDLEKEQGVGGFEATTSVFSADSKFFAYNETIKQKGRRDFLKRWGSRPLEDNWRRSQKSSSVFDQDDIVAVDLEETIPNNILEKEKEKILRGIPRDAKTQKATNDLIEKAMFELGTGFRASLNNYAKSNESLLKLIERYPDTKNKAEAMYFIHLNYVDLGKSQMAESFKTRLIREFPQSPFAKYLKNPSSGTALITKDREIEMYYEDTYKLFERGAYQQASDRLVAAKNKFGSKHELVAKYELLNALCIGNLKGQNEYINALRGVILRFDGTEEQTYAREMLRFLRGDDESFSGEDVSDQALTKYTIEDKKLHYVVAVIYDTNGDKIEEIKNSINDFNTDRYSDKRLRVTGLVLNRETNAYIILIRRFSGKDDAMVYYRDASTRRTEFVDPEKFSYDVYAVNQKNYRKIIEENKVGAYRAFFDKHYLGIGK